MVSIHPVPTPMIKYTGVVIAHLVQESNIRVLGHKLCQNLDWQLRGKQRLPLHWNLAGNYPAKEVRVTSTTAPLDEHIIAHRKCGLPKAMRDSLPYLYFSTQHFHESFGANNKIFSWCLGFFFFLNPFAVQDKLHLVRTDDDGSLEISPPLYKIKFHYMMVTFECLTYL